MVAGEGTAPAAARPHALAADFEITADSLEVLAPGDQIERLFAAGRARSVSYAGDSLNVEELPEVARSDWLEGDTIIVTFAPEVAAGAPTPAMVDAPAVPAQDTIVVPAAPPVSAPARAGVTRRRPRGLVRGARP